MNSTLNPIVLAKNIDQRAVTLNSLEQRIKKLTETQTFIEDISDRLLWALDFGDCPEADTPINNLVHQVSLCQDQLENSYDKLDEILSEFKERQSSSIRELNKELEERLDQVAL